MARTVARLSALTVSRAKRPGMYPDGGGLYLQVRSSGARSWIFRYTGQDGKEHFMGLGSAHDVSLADAREKATDCRRLLGEGVDPINARKRHREQQALEAAKAVTFQQCAEVYIASHRAGWRNEKHATQWEATLKTYAYPALGSLSVQAVDTALVMKVLEPIWTSKIETASRLRGRIEAVLDAAKAKGLRQGENPARWRGHLDQLLPRPARVRRVRHHPALPYAAIGEFMAELRAQEGIAARALEFLILTVTRTSETIGARWDEIDIDSATWTVPAERIKAGKEHRVPLSAPALAIVEKIAKAKDCDFMFPGGKKGRPLSNMALLALLARMGRTDLTAHGFRSTFRDWAAEQTNYPREVAEMALAHAVGDKVEAAYRRGDLFEKRRRMMNDWAKFCGTQRKAGQVVPMRRAGG